MYNLNELFELALALDKELQEKGEASAKIGDLNISLSKKGDILSLHAETEFNDSEIKETVEEYKNSIQELDDDLFVEATEEMAQVLDIKEFSRLLDLPSYNEDEANKVYGMIDCASAIISDKLEKKIQELVDLSYKF